MRLAIEVAHWSALVPLAYLAFFRRGAPLAFWVVALAFAISHAADLLAELTGGSWAFDGWFQIVQLALFAVAIAAPGASDVLPAVALYALVGTALYFGMEPHRNDPPPHTEFFIWWWPYQGVRLASFGLFVRAAWRR